MKQQKNEEYFPTEISPFEVILIMGPPGSGKGTQGKFLSGAGNHFHLSSGDIFRGLSPESRAGQLYHNFAHQGLLVPDEVTVEIWNHYVLGLIATNRYFPKQQYLLLDGIPRTKKQVELIQKYIDVKKILLLEINDEDTLIKRLQRRALIEKRVDDMDADVLKRRIEVYQKETSEVLGEYPKSLISTFNGDQSPLEVLRDILVSETPLLSG